MKTQVLLVAVGIGLAAPVGLRAEISITRQPAIQVVSLSANVTNKVTVASTAPPILYEWRGPTGPLLAGETNRTSVILSLGVPGIQLAQAGQYYVVLTDADNHPVESQRATITVDPTFEKITEGPLVTNRESSESATWWDFDGDGWLDVYVSNTGSASAGELQVLYRNVQGVFSKVPEGLSSARKRSIASAVGDYDNDGDPDIFVASWVISGNSGPTDDLYRNDGNGVFTAVPGPWTTDRDATSDCAFVDFDRDGLLDIFVVNNNAKPCLYLQTTGGAFVKLAAAQVGSILESAPASYSGSWADYDNDGDPDLWLENAMGSSRLHRNEGSGVFSLVTPASVKASWAGGAGMWGDFDNDGWLDVFVGGFSNSGANYTNALFRNLGGSDFVNMAVVAGVDRKMNAWGAAWGDYDNDGWLDLFVAEASGQGTHLLFRNRRDGTFESLDVGSPNRDGEYPRFSPKWVDYDNDGLLDLFLTCGGDGDHAVPNFLYRNNGRALGNANHWLKAKLNGLKSNHSGIGAKIRVKATIADNEIWQVREVTGNCNSAAGPGLLAHFGLGDATKADLIRIEWPSGATQELQNVTGDQSLTVWEPPVLRAAMLPNGACQLTIKAEPNRAWRIEVSSDLKTWEPLATEIHAEVTFQYTDAGASALGQRFYRVVGS